MTTSENVVFITQFKNFLFYGKVMFCFDIFSFLYFNPSRPDAERREKINLNFYLHTS